MEAADEPTKKRRHVRTVHAGEHALTPEEVVHLLNRIDVPFDLAFLTLAATTGIRREDIVAIKLAGYDPGGPSINFYESKKKNTRTVFIDETAARRIDLYLNSRERESQWLWPSDRKPRQHISSRHAWDLFNRWLLAAGLAPRPFHANRATAYKWAKAKGWGVEHAASYIGDTIRVAQEVYGVATPAELRALIKEKPLL